MRTDRDFLAWILNLSGATGMLARPSTKLDVLFIQRAGTKIQAADALSRLETGRGDSTEISDDILVGISALNKDENKANKSEPYEVCHKCVNNEQGPCAMMNQVQAFVRPDMRKLDRLSVLAEFKAS